LVWSLWTSPDRRKEHAEGVMPIVSTFFGIVIRMYYEEHRSELEANWARMKAGQALERIRPLE
jgi:hypothetical protein